jgi:hypothetical protein
MSNTAIIAYRQNLLRNALRLLRRSKRDVSKHTKVAAAKIVQPEHLHVCQNRASLLGNRQCCVNVRTGTLQLLPLVSHLLDCSIPNVFRFHAQPKSQVRYRRSERKRNTWLASASAE